MPKNTPAMTSDDWKWKVRDAADTLLRAQEVQRDKKLMVAVRKELAKRQKEITATAKDIGGLGKALMRS